METEASSAVFGLTWDIYQHGFSLLWNKGAWKIWKQNIFSIILCYIYKTKLYEKRVKSKFCDSTFVSHVQGLHDLLHFWLHIAERFVSFVQ